MKVAILPNNSPERILKLGTFDVGTEKASKSLLKLPFSGSKIPMNTWEHSNDIGTQKFLFT